MERPISNQEDAPKPHKEPERRVVNAPTKTTKKRPRSDAEPKAHGVGSLVSKKRYRSAAIPCATFEEGWASVRESVQRMMSAKTTDALRKAHLETYHNVTLLCMQRSPYNFSEQLYHHFEELYEYVLKSNLTLKRFRKVIRRLPKCFGYLDRYYVPNQSMTPIRTKSTDIELRWMLKRRYIQEYFKLASKTTTYDQESIHALSLEELIAMVEGHPTLIL